MQLTMVAEHHVANFFKDKATLKGKILRVLSTWAILFSSKLIILEAINRIFGDGIVFTGPVHGLIAFILVVIAIIFAEQILSWIYRSLA